MVSAASQGGERRFGGPIVLSINKLLTFRFLSGIFSNHPVCARESEAWPLWGEGSQAPGRRDASDAAAHLGNRV
jgi:hypothetical protein